MSYVPPQDKVLPNTADEVVRLLDEAFPERCASPSQTERDIFFYAGQREVVRFLKALQDRRDETLLNTSVT